MNPLVPVAIARLPWRLLFLLMAIAGFGLVVLYSAAGGSFTPLAAAQGLRFCVFFCMAIVISRLPIDLFKQLAFPAYAGILALLVLVELIGAVGGGSQRWLNLGFIHLQPSELMKLAIVLAVARFYTILPAGEIRKWTAIRSEEHTSKLQSLMRISYAVFCLKKKRNKLYH